MSVREYQAKLPKFSKRGKYRNKRTEIDGFKFDSLKEGRRYSALKLLERQGEISNLTLQPEYQFRHRGNLLMSYRADFRYVQDGKIIVEDVKSEATIANRVYRIKKRAMLLWFGVSILET